MRMPITQFVPPYDPVVVSPSFGVDDCNALIKLGELLKFEKAKIGSGGAQVVDEVVRRSSITWMEPSPRTEWIFSKLNALVGHINWDKFQLDLRGFDALQYTKYDKTGHYDWHIDIIDRPQNPEEYRKLSIILMLSDPADYDGGELELNPSGNPAKTIVIKPNKGDLVLFYSHVPHRVKPVTRGERVTAVTWILGPKLC